MEKRAKQLTDLSVLPIGETAISFGDSMLVNDNLESSLMLLDEHALAGRYPMKLPMSCLLVVVSGEIRLNVNFRDIVATGNTCVVINEGALVESVAMDADARAIQLLSKMGVQAFAMPAVLLHLRDEHMTMLKQAYHMLRTILLDDAFASNRENSAASCLNLMYTIIAQGLNSRAEQAKSSRRDEIVARFLHCVHENYREHRDLGFYAAQLGLTLKYMSHVIYGQTGRHPSQWIKDYVILDAKTMLRSGRYSVQQVADELHFPNQSFFGKYFKEAVGVSPKKWK